MRMALYGTRDAGQNFELKVTEVVTKAGCEQGLFSPCVYKHLMKKLFFFHHGDDFVVAGTREHTAWLTKELGKVFVVKDRGVLSGDARDLKEIRVLNRLLRWRDRWAAGGECEFCVYKYDICMALGPC